MKIVKVDNLKGGEVLAKPILTKEYKILLSEELVLRPEYIDKFEILVSQRFLLKMKIWLKPRKWFF